ncbi:MAG: nicotinate-nucleotide adenylyltransferase [Armatimonadetes bacterium]|nr:nicotinate-nucleotide adenylyltransferase [Armatimonadota bacterium]MDE2205196.1 nicotinate-nucleotide adenylyltransferase [Armatimonadota bacterium]
MVGAGNQQVRIGVLGGVFNPIHFGHLQVAEEAVRVLGLHTLLVMPNGYPPHKFGEALALPGHRLAMAQLAILGHQRFECCEIEMAPPGPHYTVDTMSALLLRYPGADFWQIIGADTLPQLAGWRGIDALCKMVRFCVAARGCAEPAAHSVASVPYRGARVTALEMPPNSISSSDIRDRVRRGQSIRELTPAAVCEYIEQHNLYR